MIVTCNKVINNNLKNYRKDGTLSDFTYSYQSSSNRLLNVEDDFGVDTSFGEACPEVLRRDRNGNTTTISGSYNLTATLYDWRNLPLSITKSSTTYSYKCDHQDNRTYKSRGNTRYVRGAFGEELAVYNSSTLLHHNIVRPDGTVIGRREGSNRLYYHRDHLGSTRAVANASGTVVETQDYYPFGLAELVPKTFGMPGRSMVSGNSAKEKFTSHELDDEVDLYYMIARRYAPEFGRFLSVDPLADQYPGTSPYVYALNNPLSFIDPDGREVRCATEEDCERAAQELNEIHDGETNITVVEAEWEQTKSGFWNRLLGRTESVQSFKLSTGESDFDFGQNEFTSGLFDVINSTDIVFDLEFVPGDQIIFPEFRERGTAFEGGGGRLISRPGGGRALISADGNRLGEPTGVVIMHELVGHGHPAGGNRAISVNEHYQRRLGYRLLEPRSTNPLHGGYHQRIGWPRTGLYRR